MTRTGLQRGRFLAVAVCVVGLGLVAGGANADSAVKDWLDCYESYMTSTDLRSVWTIHEQPTMTLDLECDSSRPCPNSWCDTHNTEGSAWETDGCQYMRLNYLTGTTVARMVVDPPQDWSDRDFVSFYYRGRWSFYNGPATLQLQMEGNGASTFYGPEIVAATQCDYVPEEPECPWLKYSAYIGLWEGRYAITQVDLVVKDADMGGGRLYIDCVNRHLDPTPTEPATWGRLKALYR
jgi:hypothetical protein